MRSSQSTQSTQSLFESAISPMQLEMNRYLNPAAADRPSANCDILKWWKEHCKEFPLLAKCARKYLCIQASSASSERTFSTGGSIVTYKRTKLDVENVHMLVYCKDNLSKVEITSRIYEDEEEQEAEEEFLEDETQVLVPGSAKIKHLGKGKKSQVSTDSTPSTPVSTPVSSRASSQSSSRASSQSSSRASSQSSRSSTSSQGNESTSSSSRPISDEY